ncbi:MAG: SDR family oxidoreductase [Gaiella sp.]|nr:SDR family oxidoreductase [Gaiella sp.]
MSRRSLVTGGAGFIGSNLVRALLERGDRVRVLDNFSSGNRGNLEGLTDVEIVEGDLRSYERVHTAVRGAEVVFHQGALGSVPRSVQDPLTSTAVNVEGTLNVLLASRDEGVGRVVAASSSSVYGDGGVFPRVETQLANPISPYAVAKLAAERYCVSFFRVYGLETVALRYFNVFGPYQDPTSQYAAVVPRFIRAVADGVPVMVHGDGEQSRDFTYVSNVVAANLLAADAPQAPGRILNIAAGGSETVNSLAETIGTILEKPVARTHEAVRAGDVRESWADITAARETLGFEPKIGFEEGLRLTVAALVGSSAVVVPRDRPWDIPHPS